MPSDHESLIVGRPPRRMILFREFYRGRVAKSTAYGWVKTGKLRTYKVGGLVYVDVTYDEFVRQVGDQRCGEAA